MGKPEKNTFTLKTLFHFRFITCLELAKVMGDLGERLSEEEVCRVENGEISE